MSKRSTKSGGQECPPHRPLGEYGFDYAVGPAQRSVEAFGIFSAGFGQVGTASAFATTFFCYLADDFAGLDFLRQVFGDTHYQRDVAVIGQPSTPHRNRVCRGVGRPGCASGRVRDCPRVGEHFTPWTSLILSVTEATVDEADFMRA